MHWDSAEGGPEGIPAAQRGAARALAWELGHLFGCFQLLSIKNKLNSFCLDFPSGPGNCSLLAADTVLIYFLLRGWVIVFVQWVVADSPSLLGWVWDSPPPTSCSAPPGRSWWHFLPCVTWFCCWTLLGKALKEASGAVGSAGRERTLGCGRAGL